MLTQPPPPTEGAPLSRFVRIAIVLGCVVAVFGAATIQHLLVLGTFVSPERYLVPIVVGALFGLLIVAVLDSRQRERAAHVLLAAQRAQIALLNEQLSGTVRLQGAELKSAERRLVEAARLGAVGMLASGVAHDFNNVLSVVLSGASWLRQERPEGEALEVVECITSAGERGATLTRQLLALARPSRDGEVGEACLHRAIDELAPLLRRLLGQDCALELRRPEGRLGVTLPRASLEQILLNLVVNARDAMPTGGHVTIATERTAASARLVVSDTGSGMPEAVRARIFEPFFSTKGEGRGSGLGLAVVHDAVVRGGGSIEVASEPGRGTRFTLELPLSDRADDSGEHATVAAPTAGTVVLAEQDAAVRRIGTAALARGGLLVHACAGRQEALALLQGARLGPQPTFLVTELLLADGDGQSLAAEARALHPSLAIVLTSSVGELPVSRDVVVLHKPFAAQQLLAALSEAARRAR